MEFNTISRIFIIASTTYNIYYMERVVKTNINITVAKQNTLQNIQLFFDYVILGYK